MRDFLISAVLGLVIPIAFAFKIVVIFNITDFLFGMSAALLSAEKFSSLKMLRSVLKVICVFAILVALGQLQAFLDEKQLMPDFINVVGIVAAAMVFYELKSIGANFKVVFGWDFYQLLVQKIPGIKDLAPSDTASDNKPATPDKNA